MHNFIRNLLVIAFSVLVSACGLFDKDNTLPPSGLTEFKAEVKPQAIWSKGTGSSVGDEFLKVGPAVSDTAIFTASSTGFVTSTNKADGSRNWRVNTNCFLSTGPGVGNGIVVVGGLHGEVIALQQIDGRLLWQTSIPGEILAKPVIAQGNVVIKAVDGYTRALSSEDGHELWSYLQAEPNLILRGASTPLIRGHNLLVGYANGNLAKLNLADGQLVWLQQITIPEGGFAIERMIDIDADPVMFDHHIYAATYQGKIASIDWVSGKQLWSHDISSYTGMVADEDSIYISDANGFVWSFNAEDGLVNWRQTKLQARNITGPAIMGNYIVVGDGQGYLHWLDKRDGHFAGRIKIGSKVFATPIVENNVLYALNNRGYLAAYTLFQSL